MTRMDETQRRLVEWTNGQHSERLAAQILLDQGFEDLDPSHPYGGPDGGRDAICTKDGRRFVMAAYFPRGQQVYATIEDKLKSDLVGARKHNPDGVVFVTNQELRLSERDKLKAVGKDLEIVLFHMEKIAAVLDQSHMHPTRQQFLDIGVDPPPLNIALDIRGAAHYFSESEFVRDGLIDFETNRIRKMAVKSREPREQFTLQRPALLYDHTGGRPPKPLTLQQEEAAVARVRPRMEKNWPRSEHYAGVRFFPGVSFTVTNQAPSFLTRVQLVLTFHGAQGYEKEDNYKHMMKRIIDPDYEPADWHERVMADFKVPRLATNPIDFENIGDDLQVTIELPDLRPQPALWRSSSEELVVMVPSGSDPVTVTWFATASGYGSALHGETLTLPSRPTSMRSAIQFATEH